MTCTPAEIVLLSSWFGEFFERLHRWMWHALDHYGLVAVVLFLFTCGLGVPVPEDIPLLFCGVMIAKGAMHLAIAGPVAWCAILAGDTVLYTLAYRLGPRVTELPVVGSHLDKKRLAQVEKWFDQYGVWAVGIGRMFAGVRGLMVVVSGTTRFSFTKFLVADGIGAIVSGGAFIGLGFIGYRLGERARDHFRFAFISACLLVGAAVFIYFFIKSRGKTPGERAVERAHQPEPIYPTVNDREEVPPGPIGM